MVGESEQPRAVHPEQVLTELCLLLEDYSPSWYTEKQRDRVLAARRLPTTVLWELVALLEDYGPSWYTQEEHDRALAALRVRWSN